MPRLSKSAAKVRQNNRTAKDFRIFFAESVKEWCKSATKAAENIETGKQGDARLVLVDKQPAWIYVTLSATSLPRQGCKAVK